MERLEGEACAASISDSCAEPRRSGIMALVSNALHCVNCLNATKCGVGFEQSKHPGHLGPSLPAWDSLHISRLHHTYARKIASRCSSKN